MCPPEIITRPLFEGHMLVSEEQSAESSETERKNFWDCWLEEGRRRDEEEGEMEEEEGRRVELVLGRR